MKGPLSKLLVTLATVGAALWLMGVMFPIPRTEAAAGQCKGMGGWVSIGPGGYWCHMN